MSVKAGLRSIASNTIWMTGASVAQKIISFGYFWFLAHRVSLETLGLYTFALSYTTLFSIGTDIGMASVLVRDGARDPEQLWGLYRRMIRVKALTCVVTYSLLLIAAVAVGYDSMKLLLISIAGIAMLLDSIHLTNYAALRALHNTRYEAMGMVGSQALTLVLGVTALLIHAPLWVLLLAYGVSSACNVLWSTFQLLRHPQVIALRVAGSDSSLLRGGVRALLRVAFPFALAGIFTRVYSSLDAVLLERLAGDAALGLYSAPYKIAFAFQFIPMALVASLYPLLSHAAAHDTAQIPRIFRAAMTYLLAIAIPLFAGTVVVGDALLVALFGMKYAGAGTVLSLMMASLIFAFASFPVGSVLNAMHLQKVQTVIMGIVMVLNAVLNIMLIPHLGAVGAAIAAVVGYVVLFGAGLVWMQRVVVVAWRPMVWHVFLILTATGCMVVALLLLRAVGMSSVLPLIVIGGVAYVGSLMLMGGRALLRARSSFNG